MKNGSHTSASDIGRSSKNQAHEIEASMVPHSQQQEVEGEKKVRRRVADMVRVAKARYMQNREDTMLKECSKILNIPRENVYR